ncbi:MAG: class I SAM-dependent methyltransferase [Legionellaceae bacterium]|nr:class I SAM-dependent methyltransferase [Legionellaceae bacterium]
MNEILESEQMTRDERHEHWLSFYQTQHILNPSQFSQWLIHNYNDFFPEDLFKNRLTLLDWCCGNGRDSYYLAKEFNVSGIDFAAKPKEMPNTRFINMDVVDFMQKAPCAFDIVYSRFSLHTVEEKVEDLLLHWCSNFLFIEVRSDQGFAELTHDHYRRLCNYNRILEKLAKHGFHILYKVESRGLATFCDEDPIIIRIAAISSKNPLSTTMSFSNP